MRKKLSDYLARYRAMDWTILYLRLFLGGIILLHNIGKMQLYNEIINTYPSIFHMGSAATFASITIVQVVLAVLLIVGFRVRLAALLMAAGMLVSIFLIYPDKGFLASELLFVYMGSYIALIISGAGIFSLDFSINAYRTSKKNN